MHKDGIALRPSLEAFPDRAFTADRRFAIEWAIVTAYASSVSIAFVNHRSVWFDEALGAAVASLPYAAMAHVLRHVDAVHAFYYSLLHLWLYVGHSAIAMRLLSTVFAVLATVVIGTLAKRMFDESTAPAAVAVLATSTFFLYYADEARSIALTLVLCSLTALRFWRAVTGERARDVAMCGLFAVLAIYANCVALLFLAGLATSCVLARPSRKTWVRLLGTAAGVCLAITPLAVLIHANSLSQIDWIARSNASAIRYFAASIIGGSGSPARLFEACCVCALMVLGFAAGWRSRERRSSVIVPAAWFVTPFVLGVFIDHVVHPILVARYFSFLLIPIALLAGNGLATIRRWSPAAAYGIAAILGVISIHSLQTVQSEDWRSVSRLLTHESRVGEGIVFWTPSAIAPFEFAVHEAAAHPAAAIVYPNGTALGALSYPRPHRGFARNISREFNTLWLIESHGGSGGGDNDGPFAALHRFYGHSARQIFPGIKVIKYSR